jgi:hypothetical protein
MKSLLVIILAIVVIVSGVSAATPNYSTVTHMDNTNATPFSIWVAMGIVGFLLFLYTLPVRGSDHESTIAISVIAWIPIAFTAITAYAIKSTVVVADTTTGSLVLTEMQIIQHYDTIGLIYGAFFIIAIINTIRLVALHKAMRLEQPQMDVYGRSIK